MRIRITAPGIYGKNGPLPVGMELDVKSTPSGWQGRYIVLSGGEESAQAPQDSDEGSNSADTEEDPQHDDDAPSKVALLLESAPNMRLKSLRAQAGEIFPNEDFSPMDREAIISFLEEQR